MLKQRLIWLLFAGMVLIGVLVAVFSNREQEPEFGGKKLSCDILGRLMIGKA